MQPLTGICRGQPSITHCATMAPRSRCKPSAATVKSTQDTYLKHCQRQLAHAVQPRSSELADGIERKSPVRCDVLRSTTGATWRQ